MTIWDQVNAPRQQFPECFAYSILVCNHKIPKNTLKSVNCIIENVFRIENSCRFFKISHFMLLLLKYFTSSWFDFKIT